MHSRECIRVSDLAAVEYAARQTDYTLFLPSGRQMPVSADPGVICGSSLAASARTCFAPNSSPVATRPIRDLIKNGRERIDLNPFVEHVDRGLLPTALPQTTRWRNSI